MRAPFVVAILACSACAPSQDDDRAGPTAAIMGGSIRINQGTHLFCGDGFVSSPEACDDGNNVSNDGCSSTCTAESGFTCTGSPSSCEQDATFDFAPMDSAVGTTAITPPVFGGIACTAVAECFAGASGWTGAHCPTMTQLGSGTTFNNASIFTDTDGSVAARYNGSGRSESGSTSDGNVGSNDYVTRVIGRAVGDSTEQALLYHHTGVNQGYIDEISSANHFKWFNGAGAITGSSTLPTSSTQPFWDEWRACGKTSNHHRGYVNGKNVADGACAVGSADVAHKWTIADEDGGGGITFAGDVLYVGVFQCGTRIGTTAEIDAEAARQHAQLSGWTDTVNDLAPTHAHDEMDWIDTRASNGDVSLWLTFNGWMRTARRVENVGGEVHNVAVFERPFTNNFTQSRAFDNIIWLKTGTDTVTANTSADPDGTMTCDLFNASGTSEHGLDQAGACANGAICYAHAIVKSGVRTWVRLSDTGIASADAWFNLSTCGQPTSIDRSAGILWSGTVSLGANGCLIYAGVTGDNAVDVWRIAGASASGNLSYAGASGDFTVCRAWEGAGNPSLPVDTTTVAASRTQQTLSYSSIIPWRDGEAGMVEGVFQQWNFAPDVTRMVVAEVGDGVRTAPYANLDVSHNRSACSRGIDVAGQVAWNICSGLNYAGSSVGNATDGEMHWLTGEWGTKAKQRNNGVAGIDDGPLNGGATGPFDFFNATTLAIGTADDVATEPFSGGIGRVRFTRPIASRGNIGSGVGDSIGVIVVGAADGDGGVPAMERWANGNDTIARGEGAIDNESVSGAHCIDTSDGKSILTDQWTDIVRPQSRRVLLRQGGTNDLGLDLGGGVTPTAAAIASCMAQITSEHATDFPTGKRIVVAIAPSCSAASYSSTLETKRLAVNALYDADPNATCVVHLDAVLGEPGTCTGGGAATVLKAADDSGDHLHPNAAGHVAMAQAFEDQCGSYASQ